jgi:hypothetical protein
MDRLTSLAARSIAEHTSEMTNFLAAAEITDMGGAKETLLASGAAMISALGERPGRKGRPDEHYLPLVVEYLRLVNDGDRAPFATLAGRLNHEASTIRNRLHEARRRQLLTGSSGKAGGALTPKAYELLHQQKGPNHGQH